MFGTMYVPVIRLLPLSWPPVSRRISRRIRPMRQAWRLVVQRRRKWFYLLRRGGQR